MRLRPFLTTGIAMAATILALVGGAPVRAQGITTTEVPFDAYAPNVDAVQAGKRILQCTVRRATNIDLSQKQAEADIRYAETYHFTILLAAGPVPMAVGIGTSQPDKSPDPGYQIAQDQQGLFAMGGPGLDRVADYWPKHVELGKTVMGKAFSFVILESIADDPARMTAFVSRAADAVSIDMSWIHRGHCDIVPEPKP